MANTKLNEGVRKKLARINTSDRMTEGIARGEETSAPSPPSVSGAGAGAGGRADAVESRRSFRVERTSNDDG